MPFMMRILCLAGRSKNRDQSKYKHQYRKRGIYWNFVYGAYHLYRVLLYYISWK